MSEKHNDPRDIFASSASRYLASTDHQSGPDLDIIKQVASQLFPALTVDVASGAGHALRAASPYSGIRVALDLTMEMLKVAREHLRGVGLDNVQLLQAAAGSLPFTDSTVSLLTCRIAPHHFPSIPEFLQEVARVIEPEGCSIIIDSVAPDEPESDRFINEMEKLRDPSHIRSHTLEHWLELFEAAGLETISVELFERTHPFKEWAVRTGLDEDGVRALENGFASAAPHIREKFKVQLDEEGRVESYTDEKGIFVLKKGKG